MGQKQNHSVIYNDLKELLENKFSQLNQIKDFMKQKLNDTHTDLTRKPRKPS